MTHLEILENDETSSYEIRVREVCVDGGFIRTNYTIVEGDDYFEDCLDEDEYFFKDMYAFVNVDFSDEHLRAYCGENYERLPFNGVWVNCQNIETSDCGYGLYTRTIGVNNGGAIFIGCATFRNLGDAQQAIKERYMGQGANHERKGAQYLAGLNATYEKARERFGFHD